MSLTSPINRMARSGETPEQTLERRRLDRIRMLREYDKAVIDMAPLDDFQRQFILNVFNEQNT